MLKSGGQAGWMDFECFTFRSVFFSRAFNNMKYFNKCLCGYGKWMVKSSNNFMTSGLVKKGEKQFFVGREGRRKGDESICAIYFIDVPSTPFDSPYIIQCNCLIFLTFI